MNFDDFEQRLRAQPLRAVPSEWRTEILDAAGPDSAASAARPPRQTSPVGVRQFLRAWLWPSPAAWAGVAASWVLVFLLNSAASAGRNSDDARLASLSLSQFAAEWRQRQALTSELLEVPTANDFAVPSRPTVAPRRNSPDSTRTKVPYENVAQMV